MSSSFENITRRLDITPATVDTTYAKSRSISRALKKIPYTFTIPATSIFDPAAVRGMYLGQVNYTAPYAFKLQGLRFHLYSRMGSFANGPMITIRFRVGATVTRYRLVSDLGSGDENYIKRRQKVYAPDYAGQLIKPNFCIEFWYLDFPASGFSNSLECEMLTNRLIVPPSVDDLGVAFTGTYYNRAALALDMPETLPVVYPDASAWLTN